MSVTIRYFAAARAASGVHEERLELEVPSSECTVGSVLELATRRHGDAFARILLRCSFLLDELAVHGSSTPVRDGQTLDVLPPFAGG